MKLILLTLLIAVLWYGIRWDKLLAGSRRSSAPSDRPAPQWAAGATDAEPCPRCGTYVPAKSASHCGRPDCPFPGTAS
jgi:hypothetical protein